MNIHEKRKILAAAVARANIHRDRLKPTSIKLLEAALGCTGSDREFFAQAFAASLLADSRARIEADVYTGLLKLARSGDLPPSLVDDAMKSLAGEPLQQSLRSFEIMY